MDEEEVENFVENFVEKNRIDSSDVKISKRNAQIRHLIHLRRLRMQIDLEGIENLRENQDEERAKHRENDVEEQNVKNPKDVPRKGRVNDEVEDNTEADSEESDENPEEHTLSERQNQELIKTLTGKLASSIAKLAKHAETLLERLPLEQLSISGSEVEQQEGSSPQEKRLTNG